MEKHNINLFFCKNNNINGNNIKEKNNIFELDNDDINNNLDKENENNILNVNIIDKNEEWYLFYNRINNNPSKKRINYNKINKKYYNQHKVIYKYLYENGKYKHIEYKPSTYCIEKYIIGWDQYQNVSKLLQKYKYKDIECILPSIKYLKPIKIHKSTIPLIKFDNKKIFGTFVDLCIKKIINKDKYSPLEYLKTCTIYETLPENIKNITNEYELMKQIISSDFEEIISNNFIKPLNNKIFCGKFVFNISLKIYGEPDIIANNTIIDIKTDDNVNNSKNHLQLILYAIMCDVKNICIYNPLKGEIYKKKLEDNVYAKIINYHNQIRETNTNRYSVF